MSTQLTLPLRIAAAESTIKRFGGQAFAWGEIDCLRLVAHGLRELGHAPPMRDAGMYRSHLAARRSLRRMGHATLEAWVDTWDLVRIPPASALPADVLAFPSEDEHLVGLALQLSNGRIFGFHASADEACVIAPAVAPLAAWRVPNG